MLCPNLCFLWKTYISNIISPDGDLRWFHNIHWVLLSVTTSVAFVITSIHIALYRYHNDVWRGNRVHQYVVNSIVMIIEVIFAKIPIRWLHFTYSSLYLALYYIYTLILYAAGYQVAIFSGFLDWKNHPLTSTAMAVIVVFVAAPIAHSMTFALYHFRSYIASKILRLTEKTENQNPSPDLGYLPDN